jgi:iron complex outermembrane receptor protein
MSFAVLFFAIALGAQTPAPASLKGSILDAQGKAVTSAAVTAKSTANGAARTAHTDSNGNYTIDGLAAGSYDVEAHAIGFAESLKHNVQLTAGQTTQLGLTLNVDSIIEQVEVNAGIDSIAAQSAPSGGFIDERTPQSIITNTYIENFTAPIADFGEIVQIVPGTFTTAANGVGLGQSKTYFRGFPDGDYNIDFDGIPFYDTNSPTHHSWVFFPSQWIGGVDFDRSPGTASTIGPTPFGGSIHLLSKPLTPEMDLRGTFSYGTWNTKLFDVAYNSGAFGKSNLFVDWHRMTSDGYQTFNFNERNAGSLIYQYQFSPKTVLTGYSGVIHMDSNGPNISSTRCMLYGVSPTGAYSCTNANTANGLNPNTGAGIKFLLTNNSDPFSWFDQQYNQYHIPTDFEYVSLKSELSKGWYFEVKPYTYNYDNAELYSNATAIVDSTNAAITNKGTTAKPVWNLNGSPYYDGVAIAPCDIPVVKSGVTAIPCGVDKYNSYRKYGETAIATQTSKFGVFRTGMWYEWARTDRHQYPSDPANGWADQPLPNFAEQFWTNSYQPYAEFEWHAAPNFNVTLGGKYADYSIDVLHHADDGKTVGGLSCASTTAACSNTAENTGNFGAFLPTLDLNYRIQSNLAVYAQVAKGSIVPPSSVYDYPQSPTSTGTLPVINVLPKQQKNTTYQMGIVFKGQRVTIDADAYRSNFQSGYTSTQDTITGDPNFGDTLFYLTPSSTTQGIEFESTLVLVPGLSLYLNGSAGNAYYHGKLNAGTLAAPYYQDAPSGLWVANAPTDIEKQGLTYQKHGFDLGIFNNRVGEQHIDLSGYHNMGTIAPFSLLGSYVNYTIRNHSFFDQTKIRLSATNLLDSHNIQNLSLGGKVTTQTIAGTTYTDQFLATAPAINGADVPTLMAGRSFSATVTFGIAPRNRK